MLHNTWLFSPGVLALGRRSSVSFRSWLVHLDFSQWGECIWNANPALGSLYHIELEFSPWRINAHMHFSLMKILLDLSSPRWLLYITVFRLKHLHLTFLFIACYTFRRDEHALTKHKSACLSEHLITMHHYGEKNQNISASELAVSADVVLIKSVLLLRRLCDILADLAIRYCSWSSDCRSVQIQSVWLYSMHLMAQKIKCNSGRNFLQSCIWRGELLKD